METSDTPKSGLSTGLAILGLVLGIFALLAAFVPLLGSLAFLLGVPAAAVSLIALLIALARKAPSGLCIGAFLVCVVANGISWWQYSAIKQMGEKSQKDIERMFGKQQVAPSIENVLKPKQEDQQKVTSKAAATMDITGRICFGDEARPIPFAKVIAGDSSAVTDWAGEFRLSVPSGVNKILVSADGFTQSEVSVEALKTEGTQSVRMTPQEQEDTLHWKKLATIQIPDLRFNDFIPRMVTSNKYIWLFYEEGYYYCSFNQMANADAWQYRKYPELCHHDVHISNGIVHGDTFVGYYAGARNGAHDIYTAQISESGELVDWQHQFYEPQIERSVLLMAYNRLYLLGADRSTVYNKDNFYELSVLNSNMTVSKWHYYWYDPKDTFSTRGACADFWEDSLYIVYGNKDTYGDIQSLESVTFPLNANGTLATGSFNLQIASSSRMNRLVCIAGRVYLFTDGGVIYWADITDSSSIYEWKEMQTVLPEISSRSSAWYDVAKTKSGILYIHNYKKEVRLANNQEGMINLLDIYHAVIPALASVKEDTSKVTVAELGREATIKPESEIRLLRRDMADGRLIGWDDVQKRWIYSVDDGKTWDFFDFSYDKRDGTKWLALEQFPDTHEWLAMHQTGLYRVSKDFKEWTRVEGGLPGFRLNDPNINHWRMQSGRIAINEESPNIILLCFSDRFGGEGVYKSADKGKHWLRRDSGIDKSESMELIWVPGLKDVAVLKSYSGIFVTQNAGESWENFYAYAERSGFNIDKSCIRENWQDYDDLSIVPAAAGELYFVGGEISVDFVDFMNKKILPCVRYRDLFGYEGFVAFTTCATSRDDLLIGSNKRVFRFHKGDQKLDFVNEVAEGKEKPYFSFAVDPNRPSSIFAGSKGCVFFSDNSGQTWTALK